MKHQKCNQKIKDSLTERGIKNIGASNTKKSVLEFEKIPQSKKVFETIVNQPFLRSFIQLLMREELPVTKDQVQQVLEKNRERLKKNLKESPDKNLLCRSCSEIIHRYNKYEEKRPSWKTKCPACNAPNMLNQCTEEDDWSFPVTSVIAYIDKLKEISMLNSSTLGNCSRCMRSDIFQPVIPQRYGAFGLKKMKEYIKKLHCEECGRLYDLIEIYNFEKDMIQLWVKNEGVWLECISKILSNPIFQIVR